MATKKELLQECDDYKNTIADNLIAAKKQKAMCDALQTRLDIANTEVDLVRRELWRTRLAMSKVLTELVLGPCKTPGHVDDDGLQEKKSPGQKVERAIWTMFDTDTDQWRMAK